jgi:tetratricopeptide (TPR) repeat protein
MMDWAETGVKVLKRQQSTTSDRNNEQSNERRRRKRMTRITRSSFGLVVSIVLCGRQHPPVIAQETDNTIVIRNLGYLDYKRTYIDAGPAVGEMLNWHYFPGLEFYRHGYFTSAKKEMDYVIERPQYIKSNPRQAEFMSNSHYVRGMIYFYYASGLGRHLLAKKDFEQSIRWNPKNYPSYLELSRLWSAVGKKEQAISVLHRLLDLEPNETIIQQARKDLGLVESGKTK